ncbi:MAG: HAMP domain-containing histidine kinase [Lachnospiraceae bacterium]|nr:HAMP domain-containing histidine kinase [Lachnospiraceae bacterium]
MIIIVCIVLVIICIILLVYIYAMRRQARGIKTELKETRRTSYNRQLKIALFDKDVNELAAEINRNLDHQKAMKLEAEQNKNNLKQSISDIAHDLRTPLTVVKGNLQMLEREETLSERGREYLRISMERTDSLREMVDDFFEMSVLESDAEAVDLKRIDATAFLMQFVIDNEAVIRDRGLTPKIDLPEKSIFIKADEMLLRRMCNNLLNNVLKYAEDEFEVALRCTPVFDQEKVHITSDMNDKDYRVSIVFSNNIAADSTFDVAQLFDRTYRGDKARPSGGAGLGLYIVKLLADKQGAQVAAEIKEDMLVISMSFEK